MSDILPFPSRYLQVNGHRMHYLDEGAGETVVMVHGNPSWSIYYRNLVGALKDRYRCLVPDHIGMGLSDKPGDNNYSYTLKRRVDDLDAFLKQTAPKGPVTLVVHDWGGMIGMAWAHRYPDRIKRLVVLNTAAFRMPDDKTFPPALWLGRNTALGTLLIRGFNAFARQAARIGCKRNPMPLELQKAYCAPYDSWANRIATLRFVQDIPLSEGDSGYDLVSEVEQGLSRFADLPILICWGELDFVFDAPFRRQWERHFPQAETHSFVDCGHYILEDAVEEVIPLVDRFLEQHPLEN